MTKRQQLEDLREQVRQLRIVRMAMTSKSDIDGITEDIMRINQTIIHVNKLKG